MLDDFLMVNYGDVSKKIIRFIAGQVSQRKKNGVVIGISGGVDSSVAAVLASRALKNKKIVGLIMPEKGVTPKTDIQNALSLAKKLEIRYKQIPMNKGKNLYYESYRGKNFQQAIFQQDSGWLYCTILPQLTIYSY